MRRIVATTLPIRLPNGVRTHGKDPRCGLVVIRSTISLTSALLTAQYAERLVSIPHAPGGWPCASIASCSIRLQQIREQIVSAREAAKKGSASAFHAEDVDAALTALGSGPAGLSDEEAYRRAEIYGANRLPDPRRVSAIAILAAQ